MLMKPALDWKKAWDLFFIDAVQRRIIFIVQLTLALMLALTLANLTWRLIPAPAQEQAPPVDVAESGRRAEGVSAAQDLAQWHLFGEKTAQDSAPVESLPETQLNLTLSGVIAAGSVTGGGAIIASPGTEAFYPINAPLPGGATLKEVYPDRVVLERNGRLETLRLPKEGLGNIGAGQSGGGSSPLPSGDVGDGAAEGPPPTLRQFRDMAISDPKNAGDLVKINPKTADGRFVGYELQPGRDAALLSRMGLAPGDVVTSVNGVRLDSPAKALSLLRGLSSADEVRLEIERGGVPQSLIVNINQ
jgi:general secretion pathway protein C